MCDEKKFKSALLEKYDPYLCSEFIYAYYMLSDLGSLRNALAKLQKQHKFLSNKIKWSNKRGYATDEFKYLTEILDKQENFIIAAIEEIKNNKLAEIISTNFKRILEQNHLDIKALAKDSYYTIDELNEIRLGNYGDFDTVDLCHLMEICQIEDLKEFTRKENYEAKGS